MRISPLVKGAITAALMIAVSLIIVNTDPERFSFLGYSIYFLYAAGIAWTLIAYMKSPAFTGKFSDSFSQGFRCFIIIILIMVAFTAIHFSSHPEWAEQSAAAYREHLVKEGNTTNNDYDKLVQEHKDGFVIMNVSGAIFGYLITGAIFTAIGAAILTARKK